MDHRQAEHDIVQEGGCGVEQRQNIEFPILIADAGLQPVAVMVEAHRALPTNLAMLASEMPQDGTFQVSHFCRCRSTRRARQWACSLWMGCRGRLGLFAAGTICTARGICSRRSRP